MSSHEPVLFPCPRCGTGCGEGGEGGVPCKQCGWDPNAAIPPNSNSQVKATQGTPQANRKHGFLWTLVVLEIVACAIGWFVFAAAISSWPQPSGQNDFGGMINGFFAIIAVILLFCTSIASLVVFAFTLKTNNGRLKLVALLPLLACLPGLFIVMAVGVQALQPVQ